MILYILYVMLCPLLWILVKIISIFNKKIGTRASEYSALMKRVKLKIKETKKDVILFHSASNGELEQLKPIFREIDREQYFILLTISSPSSINHIPINHIDAYCYQAFDYPWAVYHFFKNINPKKYIITRHDIWPNHIVLSKMLSIKAYLINANLPRFSNRRHPIFISLYKYLFSKFDEIHTVSSDMKSRLSLLINDENKIKISGDTRIDEILYRKIKKKGSLLPECFWNSKNIIFGSIESKDVNIIFASLLKTYKKTNPENVKYIFVPHEIDEPLILNIESRLMELNISFYRYSNMDMKKNVDSIIIDKIGILAELYEYTKIAYIGCGFSKGVHNVVEPAIYGNTICFGPNYHILNEAVEMVNNDLAFPVKSSDELSLILNYIDNDDYLSRISSLITNYINSKSVSSNTIINEIL